MRYTKFEDLTTSSSRHDEKKEKKEAFKLAETLPTGALCSRHGYLVMSV